MNHAVARTLRWFEKDPGENFLGEVEMKDLSLSTLQDAFDVDPENLMFDCWQVGEEQRELVEKYAGIKLDLDRYDYFVEADAV